MKKYILGLILILFMNSLLYSQRQDGNRKGGDRQQAMINQIIDELQIDESQSVQLEEVLAESFKQRKALRDQDLSKEERREVMMSISEDENAKAAKILDQTQYQDFLALKKEMRERAKEQRRNRGK